MSHGTPAGPRIGLGAVYAVRLDPSDVGRRVTIRRVLDDDGRPGDVVGILRAWRDGVLSLERRTGELVDVEARTLLAGRVVAPEVSAADLARQCARDWSPRETLEIGWTLRFHDSVNRRSNSALALDLPDNVERLVRRTEEFYAARGADPLILTIDGSPTDDALAALGLPVVLDNFVMTADTSKVASSMTLTASNEVSVEITAERPARILDVHATPDIRNALDELLITGPMTRYARAMVDGRLIGTARTTSDNGWAGLSLVEVDVQARRRGAAAAMIRALAADAQSRGVGRVWLQVEQANDAGIALYRSTGFAVHHGYRYRRIT